MNRREFLFPGGRKSSMLEISCEQLYMRFLDARGDGTEESFLLRTTAELRLAGKILLKEAHWLSQSDLGRELEPVLDELRRCGGSVEYR